MIVIKNRIFHFLMSMSSIILINFIFIVFTASAENKQIILDENLRPGMTLKDAIELLVPH